MCLLLSILLLAAHLPQQPDAGAAIRTISDIEHLIDAGRTGETPFVLTGVVQRVKTDKRRFIGGDATGNARFLLLDSAHNVLTNGDRLAMRGKVRISPHHEVAIVLSQADVIGREAVRPATDVALTDIDGARHHLRVIRTEGIVTDTFADEIDPTYSFLIVRDGNDSMAVSVPRPSATDLNKLVGARLGITGVFHRAGTGDRKFFGSFIDTYAPDDIEVRVPPPADPFDVPTLEYRLHMTPSAIVRLGPRKVSGTVLAVWGRGHLMLRSDDGRIVNVSLVSSLVHPVCGARLTVVGYPETDMFRLNLAKAVYRNDGAAATAPERPSALKPADLFLDEQGRRKIRSQAHGSLLRVRGLVNRLPTPSSLNQRLSLVCGGFTLSVDPGAHPKAFDGLSAGCEIEVTGRCLIESDSWQPDDIFPRIKDVAVVLRSPDDIRIVSQPPFWTSTRLLVVIAALIALVVGIYIWNRILNRVVERRSRALLREQLARVKSELKIDERTRLAVELHDSMSQTLGGIACQIAASDNAIDDAPAVARQRLKTAERMLKACRTELRHCLFDLRSNTLGERDLAVAIRRTLDALESDADVTVDVDVVRGPLPDSTVHAILSIIRELVGNALRHGMAATVLVTGRTQGDRLFFSVQDDGCGFDPNRCDGSTEGHFGLEGIRDRLKKLHGTFEINSTPQVGSIISFSLPKPDQHESDL